jgi:hypothetical protein
LAENIKIIRGFTADSEMGSRSKLAKRVCEKFSFYNTRRFLQICSCVKALRDLEKAGFVTFAPLNSFYDEGAPKAIIGTEPPLCAPVTGREASVAVQFKVNRPACHVRLYACS